MLHVQEEDGSVEDIDLTPFVPMLLRAGKNAPALSDDGVVLGELDIDDELVFELDGVELSAVESLDLLARGVVEAVRRLVETADAN